MTNLSNTSQVLTTNKQNQLSFKQINTQDYETNKIQQNIQELAQSITTALNQKVISMASTPKVANFTVPVTLIPQTLVFGQTINDTLSMYNTKTGGFTAPDTGTYIVNFQGNFDTVGLTYLKLTLFSTLRGAIAEGITPVIANKAYLNFTMTIPMQNKEQVSFQLSADAAATLTLSYQAYGSIVEVS